MMLYTLVTVWTCKEDSLTFRRTHVRRAKSARTARDAERRHNNGRLRDGMRADGWTFRIASCALGAAL